MNKVVNPCEACGMRDHCRRECFAKRDYHRALRNEQKRQEAQARAKKEKWHD